MDDQAPKGRLAIIAGNGRLPVHVAEAARLAGDEPLVIPLIGESDADWSGYDHEPLGLANIAAFDRLARSHDVDRIVLSGGVRRRPAFAEIRLNLANWLKLPGALRKLVSGGDNAVLTMVVGLLETENRKVIGVQDIVPDLLAQTGPLGATSPDRQSQADIRAAVLAARRIGELDIGQGAVAVGGRVVALEGPEGTDRMLQRVAELRAEGRISRRKRGVLVKLCKPQQDRRVDLPSIGPSTIASIASAGLAGVAIEAGRALVLERNALVERADASGLFVTGIEPDHLPDAMP